MNIWAVYFKSYQMNSRKCKSPFPEPGYLGSQGPSSVFSAHLEEIISGRHQGGPGKTGSMSFHNTLWRCGCSSVTASTSAVSSASGPCSPKDRDLGASAPTGQRCTGHRLWVTTEAHRGGTSSFRGFIFNCRPKTCPFMTCPETFQEIRGHG